MSGQISPLHIAAFSKMGRIFIATVRKDGSQSKASPLWFTVTPDHLILVQTRPTTWLAARIRRGSPVILWLGKRNGPAVIGRAEITQDPVLMKHIVDDYPRKYLLARLGIFWPRQKRFDSGEIVAIKITPISDLPDGFASNPGQPAPILSNADAQNAASTGD